MEIGVPKEIKDQEFRVGLSPNSVRVLADYGHRVFVQAEAGIGSGFTDLAGGLNVTQHRLVHPAVCESFPDLASST